MAARESGSQPRPTPKVILVVLLEKPPQDELRGVWVEFNHVLEPSLQGSMAKKSVATEIERNEDLNAFEALECGQRQC